MPLLLVSFINVRDYINPTMSNLERTFLLEYSLHKIQYNPLWGIGLQNFSEEFRWSFESIFNYASVVDGPHNLYAEFSVMYGIPFMLVFTAILYLLLFLAIKYSHLKTPLILAGFSTIAMLAAFSGFSGGARIEVLLAFILLFSNYSREHIPFKTNLI